MLPTILGLGGLRNDAACCILQNGRLVAAVEQSKVARSDRPSHFPQQAFEAALHSAHLNPAEIDCIAVARPFAHEDESAAQLRFRNEFPHAEIVVVEHHLAHAASAFHASGFTSASVLTADRNGDYRSAVLFRGENNQLTPVRELYHPDSLADLFSRVTELLGYISRADEHKVQWMSASGQPRFTALFRSILFSGGGEWPHIDRSFFDADRPGKGGFSAKLYDLLGAPLHDIRHDLAASLQAVVADAVATMLGNPTHVCLAGGLAFNALLVRALETRFDNVFVQPAAGNAGTALGAAFHAWHHTFGQAQRIPFETLCLGPSFTPAEVKQVLENCKLHFRYVQSDSEVIDRAVAMLDDNKIVAWMQGAMEFGPRALGNRSILASPLDPYSTENLNVYIKHRESYRKFAASVPEEHAAEYFDVGPNAKYLATVGQVKPKHKQAFRAALIGDDYIRVHTVRKQDNPLFHALLCAAGASTGLPVLYNTSFNLFGDPLVCTPRDAVRSFYSSGIDALICGNFVLEK